MRFIKSGENDESNIFNRLDEKKRELLASGKDVINLSIGTPDFKPDIHVMEAVSRAARDPLQYKYSLSESTELLEAVENWYQRRYGVTLAKDEIMVVSGSQEGIAHIGFAVAGPGDLILAPDPGYPIFSFGPMMAGAEIGLYPLYEEKGWILDFGDIPEDVARRAKAIVVSYPNNPTTAVAGSDFYTKLVEFAKTFDITVIHDNAYSDLLLNGETGISFLATPGAREVGIEFNSLSKTYNLTGMRVSFALGNRKIIRKFRAFRSQIDYGMFYPIMAGAAAALNGPQDIVRRNREGYMARRDALCGGLRRVGWHVPDAQGTMFVWAKIPAQYKSSAEFVIELMGKTGVICVPGESFGERGYGFVRFALVVPPERIEETVRRIDESGMVG